MVAENLKLVIQTEVAKAISDLKKFSTETNNAKSNVNKFQEKIASWVKGLGAAYLSIRGLQMALKYGLEASQIAADASQIGRALDSMARESGTTADRIVQNLKRASGGTIAELDLMRSASKAALFDLPLDQIDRLMEIARASATATGESVQYMFDSIVTGIARGSPMILDNLGLTLKIGDATEKYAASLGKSADALTAEERKMATLNAVLEAGGKIIERVGDAAREFTDAERAQKYKAAMVDLKKEIGTSLLPVYRELLTVQTNVVEKLSEFVRASRAFDNIRAGAASVEDQIIAVNVQIGQMYKTLATPGNVPGINMDDYRETIRENIQALESQRAALYAVQAAEARRAGAQQDGAKKAAAAAKAEEARAEAVAAYLEKLNLAYVKTKEGQIDALRESIAYWEKQLASAGLSAPKIEAVLAYLREELESLADAAGDAGEEFQSLAEWVDVPDFLGQARRVAILNDSIRQLGEEVRNAVRYYEILGNTDSTDGIDAATTALLEQERAMQRAGVASTEYAQRLKESQDQMALLSSSIAPFTDAFGAMIVNAETGAEKLKEASKAAIAAILEMLAKEAFARAALAFAALNVPQGAAFTAAGVAAMVAAGAVKALAEGGIVTRPTMALVGERGPEAVIPLNKAGGMGPTVIVNVQGSVLEEEGLARRIAKVVGGVARGY